MSASSPHRPPSTRTAVLLAVLAAVTAALGTLVLVRADHGLTVRQVTVGGVPMTEVRAGAPTPDVRRPGVVIAHGFAGSGRLMRPIADTVARRGAVALLIDFAGHGANPARLGADVPSARLAADMDAAVGHLRSLPDVDEHQIMLVGHSMGAGAVTRYAADHPEIARTVAISLPSAGELPPGRPAELLLIVGGAEFPAFRRAADDAVGRGASMGRRPAVVVPGVEHISVLFAPRTHREIAHWLPSADGNAAPRPLARLAGAALLVLAFGVGVVPLAALLLPTRATPSRRPAPQPTPAHDGPVPPPGPAVEAPARRATARTGVAALTLTAYAVLAVALPIHLGLTSALPVGARWWLLPLVLAGCLLFLLGVELAAADRTWRHLLAVAVAVLVLATSAVVGLAPGFVLLVVPLFALLLGWHAVWAAVLRRYAAPRWLSALLGAALVSWPIATTLPLS
ncbi:alpha/beta fold hydrolase [Micromonospora sp. NPDC047527]|uniref:alpha/beta fold hydrolase n=1 Tax=Micromonospora sp. NPDC047527 TaxID=3155144 RepID=UPI0034119319